MRQTSEKVHFLRSFFFRDMYIYVRTADYGALCALMIVGIFLKGKKLRYEITTKNVVISTDFVVNYM